MTRSLLLVVAGTSALFAFPCPAAAHGGALVERVCGPTECVAISDGLYILEPHEVLGELRGQTLPAPPPVAPYVELEVRDADPGVRAFFVPRSGLVRMRLVELAGHSAWVQLQDEIEAALRRAARDVEPFPRPRFDRVFVGVHEASNPDPYARLYDAFPTASLPPASAKRLRIVLRSAPPSPWSDGEGALAYVPSSRTLLRGEHAVRPSPEVVALLERPAGAATDGSRRTVLLATALAVMLAVCGTIVARGLRRRRP